MEDKPMKKIVALALTLLMVLSLASVSLAADIAGCEIGTEHLLPGESYKLIAGTSAAAVTPAVADGTITVDKADTYITLKGGAVAADVDTALGETGNDTYRVTASWTVGGAMVSGVKWVKDDKAFELVLNENYTISAEKKLEGTITFTSKKDKNKTIKIAVKGLTVSNHLLTVEGYKKQKDAEDDVINAVDNTLYQCDEDNPGYICFNDGRLLSCTLKMVKNEKAFMYNDEKMIDAIDEKFGDTDARIDCYNFGGSPKFTNDAAFKLQADYADQYKVYTWANGKLTKQDYKWDSINGVYTWSTKTPTTYVISDKELTAASETSKEETAKETTTTKNPDTGANDVVGVAAALAVVSLAAAAAVSLKK